MQQITREFMLETEILTSLKVLQMTKCCAGQTSHWHYLGRLCNLLQLVLYDTRSLFKRYLC